MNLRFDGGWRWAIFVGVFVGLLAGMSVPDDWNIVVRSLFVGSVSLVCLIAIAAVRAMLGKDGNGPAG